MQKDISVYIKTICSCTMLYIQDSNIFDIKSRNYLEWYYDIMWKECRRIYIIGGMILAINYHYWYAQKWLFPLLSFSAIRLRHFDAFTCSISCYLNEKNTLLIFILYLNLICIHNPRVYEKAWMWNRVQIDDHHFIG